MGWDMKVQERIGKIIPNEFSKMAAYLKYIPYVGQAAAIAGSIDAGATANSDIYNRMKEEGASSGEARTQAYSKGIPFGMDTFSSGNDPGWYGSQGNINPDIWNKVGSTGSFFGKGSMFGQDGSGMQGGSQGMGQLGSMFGKGSEVVQYWDGTENIGYDPALEGTKYANPSTGFGWTPDERAQMTQPIYNPYMNRSYNDVTNQGMSYWT